MKPVTALVLAGGIGTRFWPLATDKAVFPLGKKRLIDLSVKDVLPEAVSRVVFVVNDANRPFLSTIHTDREQITVVQKIPSGMAGAVMAAESQIRDSSLLIIIADDIVEQGLFDTVLKTAQKKQAFGVLPAKKVDTYFPGGYLVMDGEKIRSIKEKPGEGNEPGELVAISGHYLQDANMFLEEIKKTYSENDDVYEAALTRLMAYQDFYTVAYEGLWCTVKYPWHVLDATECVLGSISQYRGKDVIIKDGVVIDGPVHLEDGVKVFEHTKIVGPCYIGKNTIIGNNNIIRNSIIGDNCVTGFSTDITRSYIGDNCWFHTNYIGDSVLEGNVSFGSGTVTANLRLDEAVIHSAVKTEMHPSGRTKFGTIIGRNVRVGVNASIMPGVKIGSGSSVGAGLVIAKDIPENSFCIEERQYSIRKNTMDVSDSNRTQYKLKLK